MNNKKTARLESDAETVVSGPAMTLATTAATEEYGAGHMSMTTAALHSKAAELQADNLTSCSTANLRSKDLLKRTAKSPDFIGRLWQPTKKLDCPEAEVAMKQRLERRQHMRSVKQLLR